MIKGQSASVNNTTLKLAGSGSPHGSLGTSNVTLSLTRSETGSSSGFGQTTHAWIYIPMGPNKWLIRFLTKVLIPTLDVYKPQRYYRYPLVPSDRI